MNTPPPKPQPIDNRTLYDANWNDWADTKRYGPGNRYLQYLIRRAARQIEVADIKTMLDVGCGTGDNTYLLATLFPTAHVTGIDFSATGIEYARRTWQAPNLEFLHDPLSESLSAQYDLIGCFEVLEHVDNWRSFLQRMACAAQRYLFLSCPVGRMRAYEVNVGHLRNFRTGEIEQFLHTITYEPVRLQYAGFPFYSPLFRDAANMVGLTSSQDPLTRGAYGWKRKLLAELIYGMFRFGSTKEHWGEKYCALFRKMPVVKRKKDEK